MLPPIKPSQGPREHSAIMVIIQQHMPIFYTTKVRQISLKNYYLLPYGGLNCSTTPTEIKSTTPAKQNTTATPKRRRYRPCHHFNLYNLSARGQDKSTQQQDSN